MAMEVAVRIQCSKAKLAIFIQESELDGTLSEARSIIAKQDVEVPNQYRFLSSNGNVIPWAMEETLVLKQLFANSSEEDKVSEDDAVKLENQDPDTDNGSKSENAKSSKTMGMAATPELWLVNLDEKGFCLNDETQAEVDAQRNGLDGPSGVPVNGHPQFCPWKGFVTMVHDRSNTQNLLKILFFILVVLFMMLFSLALTTHLILGVFSSLNAGSEFSSIISKFKTGGSDTEELTNLRLKLSELELTWKYNFDELNNKLIELEDLYLKDLVVQKREMAALKSHPADSPANFANKKDLEALKVRMDQLTEVGKKSKQEADDSGKKTLDDDKKGGKKDKKPQEGSDERTRVKNGA